MASDEPAELLALPPAPEPDRWWFAVDRCGHVGLFVAGELGPMPDVARSLQTTQTDELLALLTDTDPELVAYDAADVFESPAREGLARFITPIEILDAPPRFDQSLFGVLVQLRSVDGARERLARIGLHVLPGRDGAYAWGHVASPVLRELWREGWVLRAAAGHELEPSRAGLFRFEHMATSAADDVYARWAAPRVPLRVHALPTSLRSRLGAARFPAHDFREAGTLRASRVIAAAQTG